MLKRIILNGIAVIPLFLILYYQLFNPLYIVFKGVKTRGVVIAIDTHYPDEASNNTYSIVLEFNSKKGRIEYRPSSSSIALPYTINDAVDLYYLEENPYKVFIFSWWNVFLLILFSVIYIPFFRFWYEKIKLIRRR